MSGLLIKSPHRVLESVLRLTCLEYVSTAVLFLDVTSVAPPLEVTP